jgi:integrase
MEMANRIRGHGEGSIYQRSNGTWRAQISVNGERISYGAKTKPECIEWLTTMQFQLNRGFDLQGRKMSLKNYLEHWLENHKVSSRPKTYLRYKGLSERYIIPRLGDTDLNDLHPLNIERFYANLITDGVGIRSVRLCHSILHSALGKAIDYGWILRNPARGVTQPQYKPSEMQVWNDSQVSLFLVIAESSRHKALYQLAITTGMRQGEIFGLKWTDLHWNLGEIQIQRQVQRIPGEGWSYQEPKTRTGRRKIILGEGTLHALRLHREQQLINIKVAGERWQSHELIFPNSVGNPMDSSNLRLDFNRLVAKAGLPKIRFHDLRHTAASLMLNNGVPPIVVSRILGHAKPSITLDLYGHLYHEMQGEAAKIMDELVTPIKVKLPSNEILDDELHQSAPENANLPGGQAGKK